MKKVLIITYYWPPGSGPGVQRFLKMSKFLNNFGWEPVILTVKNGSYPSVDRSLEKDVPSELKVYKSKTIEPFAFYNKLTGGKKKQASVGMIGLQDNKSLMKKISLYIRANYFIPDARKGWIYYAYKKALKINKEEKPDAIITTGPPHSTHLTGLKLAKKLNLPWIADLRDPWTNIFYNTMMPRTKKTIKKDKKLENKVIKNADYITTVSSGLKEEFEDRSKNIKIIYNGYDKEDIPEPEIKTTKKFRVSYIGNFKPNQNVEAFWAAASELCDKNQDFKNNLEISLTGNIDQSIKASIKKHGLDNNSFFNPFVPHKEATRQMNSTNMLLFIVPQAKRNNFIITGKLFEYIAINTPILSIGPQNGDASKILSEAGRDKMFDYNDKEGIKKMLEEYYNKWKTDNYKTHKFTGSDFQKFSRYSAAKKLSEILNEIS